MAKPPGAPASGDPDHELQVDEVHFGLRPDDDGFPVVGRHQGRLRVVHLDLTPAGEVNAEWAEGPRP